MTAQDVIQADLEYIGQQLADEFATMRGKPLFISGGAGFLGYYLVQSVLYWNQRQKRADHIPVTVSATTTSAAFLTGFNAWQLEVRSRCFSMILPNRCRPDCRSGSI